MDLPFYEKEKLDSLFPFLAWERVTRNFWFPLHWHSQVELVHILSGRLNVMINGENREGREGDIVMVDTGQVHGFSNPDQGTGVRIFQFGLEIFSNLLPEVQTGTKIPLFSQRPLVTRTEGALHSRLLGLLDAIFAENRRRDAGFRLLIISKIYEFAAALLRESPTPQRFPAGDSKLTNNHDRLDRVFAFIEGNFDNPKFSLKMAAEQACLNKGYFSRFLKEQTGQSFYEYLARRRIHQAEQYLVESDMPITEIAYSCGFNSIATFNRIFKTYASITPSDYRGRWACSRRREKSR
jgi:AraC-like DNA-binding protein